MSLNEINNYVNNLITSNRDLDPENISMYFKLMEEEASLMLDKLGRAQRLLGLEKVSNDLLNFEEKAVIRAAVDYILVNSDDLGKDLDLLNLSGLLCLDQQLPGNRYHIRYNLEMVLQRASELYYDNLGWWSAFVKRNKPRTHFIEAFEKAALVELSKGSTSQLSSGLEMAR